MATEYGYQFRKLEPEWCGWDEAVRAAQTPGFVVVAREVSEPRIVSIRA